LRMCQLSECVRKNSANVFFTVVCASVSTCVVPIRVRDANLNGHWIVVVLRQTNQQLRHPLPGGE
jgi:hypothetical protein